MSGDCTQDRYTVEVSLHAIGIHHSLLFPIGCRERLSP